MDKEFTIIQAQMLADEDYRDGENHNPFNKSSQYNHYMSYEWRMHSHLNKELSGLRAEIRAGV